MPEGAPLVVNSLDSVKSDLLDVPIIQSVIVQDKPNSYEGGSKSELTKSNAKFCSLSLENMCEGAKFYVPRKVVETSLTMGVPLIEGTGFTIKTITIEYEWKPPQCDLCKIFGHVQDHCPKKVSITPIVVTSNVATPTTTVTSATQGNIPILNPYSALDDESDEEVKNVYDESANLFQSKKTGRSSSTYTDVVGYSDCFSPEMLRECDSLLCHSQFTLYEALAKKKAPFGVMFSTLVGTKDVSSVLLVGTEESCVDEVYFTFGWHLEDLHVTWAHLEKKQTRLRTNTNILEDLSLQTLETASEAIHDAVAAHQATASQDFMTALARIDSKADLEDSSHDGVLENQPLSVSLLICLGKRDCVERIPASIFSLCYLFRNSFLSTTMGDENPIRTLGDYSRPSHEGYRNTIELPAGNNVVPLRSDTIRLVQNGCSFHGLRSEDPNQHLKDFLKLVDSLDLDGENRERTRLRLFQFSLRDQASNWLERLPAGSISTWEDLTTRFLAQFFPPGRTAKLRNDILMFQQHHGESLSEAWTRFKDLLQKVPHHGIDLWLQDIALYDNKSWNDPRDFAKPVKAIALPQDVPSTSDRRLIELETQVQRLMEAHLALTQPTQVNKITTSCEICSGPHDTQNCMENPEQAFVDYASTHTDEAGEGLVSEFMASQDARLSRIEADFKRQQSEMTNKIDTVLRAITNQIADSQCSAQIHSLINAITIQHDQPEKPQVDELEIEHEEGNLDDTNPDPQSDQFASIATEQVRKLNSMLESLGLVPRSSNTKFVCSKEDDREVMHIEIIRENDEPPNEVEEVPTEEPIVEYFDTLPTREELTYHRYLMSGLVPSIFLKNPIITEGCPHNLKILCNIGHVHIEKACIYLNSPLNVMTRMMYNWIMRRKLAPREDTNGRVSNFTGRVKGMHVFIGNFTYLADFMIVEDISSIIDPRLSQVVLGRPFIEVSNMTHDLPEGVVRFTYGHDDIAYKMPYKIEQYYSLSDLEKEHTKSVYLRNEEDKRRGVEYVMSKVLGFYKECLELGPEYLTGVEDEGEVTYFAFGWHLEDLHVTWAHLEKKRTRLRTNTKILEDLPLQTLETASEAIHDVVAAHQATASQDFTTASARADSKADLEDSSHDGVTPIKRGRRHDFSIYTNRI
ncbi:MAK10-like protein [Tanacetum coccineum]